MAFRFLPTILKYYLKIYIMNIQYDQKNKLFYYIYYHIFHKKIKTPFVHI